MKPYKDTYAAKNSALGQALSDNNEAQAKKTYDETTVAFFNLYGEENAKWFIRKHKESK